MKDVVHPETHVALLEVLDARDTAVRDPEAERFKQVIWRSGWDGESLEVGDHALCAVLDSIAEVILVHCSFFVDEITEEAADQVNTLANLLKARSSAENLLQT